MNLIFIELGFKKIKQKVKKITQISFLFGLLNWQTIRFYEEESAEETIVNVPSTRMVEVRKR